ncbi:MAG: hypothetical protein ACKVTZ_08760, partial [Bacteroidia bacterium]
MKPLIHLLGLCLLLLLALPNYASSPLKEAKLLKTLSPIEAKNEIQKLIRQAKHQNKVTEKFLLNYLHKPFHAQNAISVYKITFETKGIEGKPTICTGTVWVPSAAKSMKMVLYQKVTTFKKTEVLSNWSGTGEGIELVFPMMFA